MAKKIISQGATIDKLRADIVAAISAGKREDKRLTRQGVQIGRIHYKTDRPNTMYVLEPSVNGKRKYVHVGTDPKKQAQKRAQVDRWQQRDQLRKAMAQLETDLQELDWRLRSVTHIAEGVHELAAVFVERHINETSN